MAQRARTPAATAASPAARARPGRRRPLAVGRRRVRSMRASASRSMTLLRIAAPATVRAVAASTAITSHASAPPASSIAASTVTRKSATIRGWAAFK